MGKFAFAHLRQICQQLREIELWVDVVPTASAGEAGQDRRRSAAAWIAHEETVLAIKNDALHLSLRDVVVDADRAICAEHVQFRPLAQRVVHRLGHGVLRQQLFLPGEKPFA